MKKLSIAIFVALALSCMTGFAQSQDDECNLYRSYYTEYYKQGTKDAKLAAIPSWRKAYAICSPTKSQNLYIQGADLLRLLIALNSKDKVYREALVDSLITLDRQRAMYFPKYAGKAYAALSADVNNYLKDNPQKAHDVLSGVIESVGSGAAPVTFLASMNAAVSLYKDGKMKAEDVIKEYTNSAACFSELQKTDTTQMTRNLRTTFENAFINSNVASCDNLIEMFQPRFNENKDDIATVKSIASLMSSMDCTDNDLFLQAVTQMHKLEPSANSAFFLYRLNAKKDPSLAMKYLDEASSSSELDADTKAQYTYELAAFSLKNGFYGKSVDAANKAMAMDSSYTGKCCMIIAHAWMSLVCGGNEIEARAKYWVAVDYFNKAKNADPSLAEDANKQIGTCVSYFPATSEAFMYDVTNGQSYNVSCGGLRAVTTVRTH